VSSIARRDASGVEAAHRRGFIRIDEWGVDVEDLYRLEAGFGSELAQR
jgi:hypothetical protein